MIKKIEVDTEIGIVYLKVAEQLFDANGNAASEKTRRESITPGDSTKLRQYLKEADAAHIENNVWTQDVIDAWQAKTASE